MLAELPASNLREGLTKPKRPRDGASETRVGLVTSVPEAMKGREEAAAAKPAVLGTQSDLPPVLAGPGR